MCPSLLVLVSIEARARYWLSDNRGHWVHYRKMTTLRQVNYLSFALHTKTIWYLKHDSLWFMLVGTWHKRFGPRSHPRDIGLIWIQNVWHRLKLGRPGVGPFFCRNTRFEVCLVISVDPDQVLLHAASGRSLYLYCSQMHLIFGILKYNSKWTFAYRESPGGDTGPGVHFFTFSKCTFKIYSFWRDAKSANPEPMLLLRVRPGFALIAVCSSVIHRNIQLAMMRRLWW